MIVGARGRFRVKFIVLLTLLESFLGELIISELRNQSRVVGQDGLDQTTVVTLVLNRIFKPEVGLQAHRLSLGRVAYRLRH